jgi:uncharacterized protein
MNEDRFLPPLYLRGSYTQTILASARIRALGRNPMKDASKEMIIDAGEGVRLQGFYSPQLKKEPIGLMILLHGWEGSAESTYIRHSGRFFYEHGYAVFRLNFRDHGDSHHLNQGIFYSVLLDEVFSAVRKATGLPGGTRSFLIGFSLGGNFALRIARKCKKEPIENLWHIMSISPAINPSSATDAIDGSRLLRGYFLKKWKRSLKKKQELFPQLYDFQDMLCLKNLRALTDVLLKRYSTYPDTEEYFRSYAITSETLAHIDVPTTIIASRDDPAIPIQDFSGLTPGPKVRMFIHDFGGHNGFLHGIFTSTWYEMQALDICASSLREFENLS